MHLEMYLRVEALPLAGRDHLMFRSFYHPVKNVIDGDLCEEFAKLTFAKQRVISEELDRTYGEVLKKMEDIRNRILWKIDNINIFILFLNKMNILFN